MGIMVRFLPAAWRGLDIGKTHISAYLQPLHAGGGPDTTESPTSKYY